LFAMEKKQVSNDDVIKSTVRLIQKIGVRKTARQTGEHEKTIRRWIKTGNIPSRIVQKLAALRT